MRDVAYDDRQLDDVARITQDVQRADNATLGRLRSLVAATLRATPDAETQTIVSRLIRSDVSEEDRRTIREVLVAAAKIETPPVCMVRVDEREDLIEGRVAGPLSALAGAERLGPFVVDGGRVWFDFYHAAQRFVVTETGASSPAFVLTSARRPAVLASGSLTLDLQEGTVWIRGNLLTPSLPAGAYVGITVTDGTIALPDTVDVTDDEVEISAPAEATLQLALDPGEPAVAEGGCHSDSGIELSTLALHIESGHLDVEIEGGAAGVWGQVLEFGGFTGAIDFVAPLWSLVLGVDFRPEELCMDGVSSEVCDFREVTRVLGAGLGLPVVVADPSILGPTEITPGWWLALEGFQARWYASDERFHTIDGWMCINSTGISLFSDAAPGLERPVSTCYRLWELKESPDHRVPWQLTYEDRFVFYYRCDTIQGEDLLATGESDVALDRPVLARGEPVRTPTAKSAIHLHRAEGAETQITLVASTKEGAPENLLVLRNALCWTTRAAMLVAQGSLMEREDMHAGALHVLFGVLGWTPTLPDPYVGNFQLCKPVVQNPSSLLVARVSWDAPADVITAFNGQLGAPVVCDKPASVWRPVPLRQDDLDPDLGLTQTAQHTRHLSEEELRAWPQRSVPLEQHCPPRP